MYKGFPRWLSGKEAAYQCRSRDKGSIPRWGTPYGEGNGNPFLFSSLGNPMDRGAWLQAMESQRVGHNLATQQYKQRERAISPFINIPSTYISIVPRFSMNLCIE